MRIRRAEERDLSDLARIFVRSVTQLTREYRPDQIGRYSVDPESRLPLYRHLLATGAMFAAEDPEPVGFSAAIVRDGVWFLSQLWVLPERQGRGIGAALFDEALAWGRGARAFTVVSSPHPRATTLYFRASMYPLWLQHEMTSSDASGSDPPPGMEPLGRDDQPWIDELDRTVRGTARPEDHALFRSQATGLALRGEGGPRGYVYVWDEGKVGPGAVRDPADTPDLLAAAVHTSGGPTTVAVPSANWTALRELVRRGFAPAGMNSFLASRPLGDAARYLSSGGALG